MDQVVTPELADRLSTMMALGWQGQPDEVPLASDSAFVTTTIPGRPGEFSRGKGWVLVTDKSLAVAVQLPGRQIQLDVTDWHPALRMRWRKVKDSRWAKWSWHGHRMPLPDEGAPAWTFYLDDLPAKSASSRAIAERYNMLLAQAGVPSGCTCSDGRQHVALAPGREVCLAQSRQTMRSALAQPPEDVYRMLSAVRATVGNDYWRMPPVDASGSTELGLKTFLYWCLLGRPMSPGSAHDFDVQALDAQLAEAARRLASESLARQESHPAYQDLVLRDALMANDAEQDWQAIHLALLGAGAGSFLYLDPGLR